MKEHGIQNGIRNALAGLALIFRANTGSAWASNRVEKFTRGGTVVVQPGDVLLRDARPFSTGLPAGFSDLFGIKPVTITHEMVGQRMAQFVALEVKGGTGRTSDKQAAFLRAVQQQGGLSGVVRSADDAKRVLGLDL